MVAMCPPQTAEDSGDLAIRYSARSGETGELVRAVRRIVFEWFRSESVSRNALLRAENPATGKMLRTILADRLYQCGNGRVPFGPLADACAAVELVHAATLYHDDVIDESEMRRGRPSLWRQTTPSASILIGDLFLCGAIDLLSRSGNTDRVRDFIAKTRETCTAEINQEMVFRGTIVSEDNCLHIARGKTGPLFAFCAGQCAGDDLRLKSALEESGYLLGTAYQLADDLIDEYGSSDLSGKTLGTDRLRRKFTLARDTGPAVSRLNQVLDSSVEALSEWPAMADAVRIYLKRDIYPIISEQCSVLIEAAAA
jgi:geranylgeranyl pyrophosphate synthase